MNRLKRKLAVNGVATIISVVIILMMIAAPVIASVSTNSVTGSSIVDRSIKTIDLALGSVKTGILGKNAVTSTKIKDGQVKTADLALGAVGTGRIKNGAVTGAKIRDFTITKSDLKSSSVNSIKIANGTISNVDIAAGAAIAASKINTAGLSADKVDGKHASDFAATAHNHDAAYYKKAIADAMYAALGHNHDLSYYTQAAADAAFASLGHDHDADYSALAHNHDATYITDDAGQVDDADIAAGAISASKINTTGLDADTLDGSDTSDFVKTNGDQTIDGTLTVSGVSFATAKTAYLSLSGADFTPRENSVQYVNQGRNLFNSGQAPGNFYAPVHLPNGAVVTKISARVYDNTGDAELIGTRLSVYGPDFFSEEMGYAGNSVNSPSQQTMSDNTINFATIDNSSFTYYVYVGIGVGASMYFDGFFIEYEYLSPSH